MRGRSRRPAYAVQTGIITLSTREVGPYVHKRVTSSWQSGEVRGHYWGGNTTWKARKILIGQGPTSLIPGLWLVQIGHQNRIKIHQAPVLGTNAFSMQISAHMLRPIPMSLFFFFFLGGGGQKYVFSLTNWDRTGILEMVKVQDQFIISSEKLHVPAPSHKSKASKSTKFKLLEMVKIQDQFIISSQKLHVVKRAKQLSQTN